MTLEISIDSMADLALVEILILEFPEVLLMFEGKNFYNLWLSLWMSNSDFKLT